VFVVVSARPLYGAVAGTADRSETALPSA
jgi:hypothetical protein